jgi:hypothetical protein
MHYTDYDFEMIPIYNEYIESIVNESNLPKNIKKKMLSKRCILKDNNVYYLAENEYRISFLTYTSWITQEERNKKLEQLLNEK